MRWTRSLKYRGLSGLVPVASWSLHALERTLRRRARGQEILEAYLAENRPGIGAFCHCDMAAVAMWGIEMARLGRPITALTSPSRDGQIFARLLRMLGLRTVAGSSSRGGAQGMLALIHSLQKGHHVAIVVDGPRGPRGVVKPGVIWLSQRSGAPIVAIAARIAPKLRLPTWDRAEIPLPFSRRELLFGNPWTPSGEIEEDCRRLENELKILKGEAH